MASTSKEIRVFDINFKEPTAKFKAGEVVAGYVQLDLAADMKMKGIKLILQGISRVQWDENKSYTKGTSSKLSHQNVDVYLDETIVLLSRVENNLMKMGRYDYPFTTRLPPYIPSSFEGQHGRVQYWAKLTIDRPWKGDIEVTKPMYITGILDLNSDPNNRQPIENIGITQAGRCCCISGPISGHLKLPSRGFVCGQNIPFRVTINNSSNGMLRNVRLSLNQVTGYKADNKSRRQTTLLKGITWRDINVGEDTVWEEEMKNIPPVPPSRLGPGCKGIDVKYQLLLSAMPAKGGKNLEAGAEIVIGTIPLRKTEAGEQMFTVKAAARQSRTSCDIDPAHLPQRRLLS